MNCLRAKNANSKIQWKNNTETYLDLGAGETPSEVMTFMLRPRRWCQQCKEWGEGEEDSSKEYKVCKSLEAGKGLTHLRKWKKISVTEPDELVGGEAGPWWSEKCLIIGQNIGFGFHSKKMWSLWKISSKSLTWCFTYFFKHTSYVEKDWRENKNKLKEVS